MMNCSQVFTWPCVHHLLLLINNNKMFVLEKLILHLSLWTFHNHAHSIPRYRNTVCDRWLLCAWYYIYIYMMIKTCIKRAYLGWLSNIYKYRTIWFQFMFNLSAAMSTLNLACLSNKHSWYLNKHSISSEGVKGA